VINTRYPQSLRQAIAYLDCNPLVFLGSQCAGIVTRSEWWFVGHDKDGLRFAAYPINERKPNFTTLDFMNAGCEVGLEFHATGFKYQRGNISVFVQYAREVRP
jgi:hypothetical protein